MTSWSSRCDKRGAREQNKRAGRRAEHEGVLQEPCRLHVTQSYRLCAVLYNSFQNESRAALLTGRGGEPSIPERCQTAGFPIIWRHGRLGFRWRQR